MEQIIIKGGNPLIGEVNISGAKNAAVALIPATLVQNGIAILDNVPDISDLREYFVILEQLGAKVEYITKNKVKIDSSGVLKTSALSDNVKKFRASYYLIGALLARYGEAVVGMPGGCNIGARPIDQHIKGFEALGAEVAVEEGFVSAKVERITGNNIYFDVVSVGATINVMLSAITCEGTTILENCAKEPHVVDVANFLNKMGANIKGAGTDTIKIKGVKEFKNYIEYSVVPDQIEAGTFMIAAVASKGNVVIKNCIPKHLEALSAKLEEMGAKIIESCDSIQVIMEDRPIKTHIKTLPYPGFPTDLQSQMGVALAVAEGTRKY